MAIAKTKKKSLRQIDYRIELKHSPHQVPRLALSIRQPFAELIMRSVKTVEERSRPTKIRGRIFIYASLGRYPRAEEAVWAEEFSLNVDALPRGVVIGTVELFDCCGDEWQLRLPERLAIPITPTCRPNPVWFRPFA